MAAVKTRERLENCASVQTPGAEPLRDSEHHLPVRHSREERLLQPERPQRERLAWQLGQK